MNYLEIINVSKSYGDKKVLDDISISVPRQSIYGLLGHNGAGKTTLIRIINQITMPDSGQILLDGKPLCQDDIAIIGYMPEERGLYKKMKVGEQAIYLARLKGMTSLEAKKSLQEWFERFDIMPWWNRKLEELSKGMQQKVQFIITVLHRPQLLIFDEPFSGFDPVNAELLKAEMLRLKNEGHTILFSTHNMASVEEICDNIALINHSQVVLRGAVDEIKERYKDHTYSLVIPENAHLEGIETISSDTRQKKQYLIVRKPQEETSASFVTRIAQQSDIFSFSECLPSMNDVFLRVVGNEEIK